MLGDSPRSNYRKCISRVFVLLGALFYAAKYRLVNRLLDSIVQLLLRHSCANLMRIVCLKPERLGRRYCSKSRMLKVRGLVLCYMTSPFSIRFVRYPIVEFDVNQFIL